MKSSEAALIFCTQAVLQDYRVEQRNIVKIIMRELSRELYLSMCVVGQ